MSGEFDRSNVEAVTDTQGISWLRGIVDGLPDELQESVLSLIAHLEESISGDEEIVWGELPETPFDAEKIAQSVTAVRYSVFQGLQLSYGEFEEIKFLPFKGVGYDAYRREDRFMPDRVLRLAQRFGKDPGFDHWGPRPLQYGDLYTTYYEDGGRLVLVAGGAIAPEKESSTGHRAFNKVFFAVEFDSLELGREFLEAFRKDPFETMRRVLRANRFEGSWFINKASNPDLRIDVPELRGGVARLWLDRSKEPITSNNLNIVGELVEEGREIPPSPYIETYLRQ